MPASRRLILLLYAAFFAVALASFGQGYPPGEAAGHMTVPSGFRVRLFACEPMIVQPVSMEFDDRGRMWVIQYLQYPNPAGLKRAKVDRYSRTTYDRVPDPPPMGPKGADRITILEDTDGDGRADKAHDFVTGLSIASGLAFGHGGVFVVQPPYLLFYPDRDRDDVPDGNPEVLLSGFGMQDAHAVANSPIFGPDGWLYGVQGSTVTSNIRGIEFQQGVWRYHPLTREFELFCEGGGNMWGLDYDARGNLFASTNFGPFVMLHAEQGAYYWKSFAKHGELHNPYAYGYFDHVTHHDAQGGHVTDGGIIYQGDSYPESFRGKYIANNLLSHAVYWHDLKPTGSTFESSHAGVLLESNDTWFAPSDLTMGPDGSLYVADWHDKRTAHPDPDADWDRSNGRIYKIEAEGTKLVARLDMAKLTNDELLKKLESQNDWEVRRARRLLAERHDPSAIKKLKKQVIESSNAHLALESLWGLSAAGGLDEALAAQLLKHSDPDIRRWTVRLLGDKKKVSGKLMEELARPAATDSDVHVRAQLAASALRLPVRDSLAVVGATLARKDPGFDHLPLLLWWVLERHAMETEQILAMAGTPDIWNSAMFRAEILPRLARRYMADASAAGDEACVELVQLAEEPEARAQVIAGLNQGLTDRQGSGSGAAMGSLYEEYATLEGLKKEKEQEHAQVSSPLKGAIQRLWDENKNDAELVRLAARVGNADATTKAQSSAADEKAPVEARRTMLEIMGETGGAESVPILLDVAFKTGSSELQLAALDALRRFPNPEIAKSLIGEYQTMAPQIRARARDILFGRAEWSRMFLEEVDDGRIKPEEATLSELRRIALYHDPRMDGLVAKHWGTVKEGTPEEKLAEMRRLNNDLRAAEGNPAAGKESFTRLCAVCHTLFGEGNKVGPDLTQSNRMDTDFLLSSLIDPSLSVRKEYLQYIIETKDGRILNGIPVERTAGSVTLLDAKNERVVVESGEIKEMRESSLSLMPEDLLKEIKPTELRDLFNYLQSKGLVQEKH